MRNILKACVPRQIILKKKYSMLSRGLKKLWVRVRMYTKISDPVHIIISDKIWLFSNKSGFRLIELGLVWEAIFCVYEIFTIPRLAFRKLRYHFRINVKYIWQTPWLGWSLGNFNFEPVFRIRPYIEKKNLSQQIDFRP